MKTLIGLVSIFLMTFSIATAQFSGQLSTAETVIKGSSIGSGFVSVYEDGFGVLGQYRLGFGGYSDFGFKAAIIDHDRPDQTGFMIGADYKYQMMEVRIQDPIDMSIGGMADLALFENFNTLSFGGFLVGSSPLSMSSGRKLTPYGRIILRIDRFDSDAGPSDSDFNIGLNAGADLELTTSTHVLMELQLDEQTALYMGVSFGL